MHEFPNEAVAAQLKASLAVYFGKKKLPSGFNIFFTSLFSLSLSGKNKQSKTINETGQKCIFRKYTASDALNCAAAVLFRNS